MIEHVLKLTLYLATVVVLTLMYVFFPTSSYALRAFSVHPSTQSYPKREASVFEVRGKRKIGLVLTTWPNLDRRVEFEESYYETEDLGTTWRRVERSEVLLDPREIGQHPRDPQIAYRTGGAVGEQLFLMRSIDGGKTWQRIEARVRGTSEVLQHYGFRAFHPRDTATLYVSGIVPGTQASAEGSESIGLYVSHDKGDSFSLLVANIDRLEFAISQSRPDTLYTTMFHQYIIKSDDGGRVWKFVDPCKQNGVKCNIKKGSIEPRKEKEDDNARKHWIYDIVIDPSESRTVYAQTDNGIWKTSDGGLQWCLLQPAPNAKVGSIVVAIDEREAAIFAGTDAGLFVSRDAGESWSWVDLEAIGR